VSLFQGGRQKSRTSVLEGIPNIRNVPDVQIQSNDSQSVCNSDHISPVAGSSIGASQLGDNDRVVSFVTYLVLKERVPEIFHHF